MKTKELPPVNNVLINSYADTNVCVIGGAGFVGHWLVKALRAAGANVIVIDNFSRGDNIGIDKVQYYHLDVRNIDRAASKLNSIDVVFNLAATVAGVLYNQEHQAEMYKSNIEVLMAPALAASKAGVPAFLQTSSVCVYAPEHNAPSSEQYGLVGVPHPANAGYAEAKRDGERFASWSNIEKVVVVRPSNIAGAGDYFDEKAHVIPALVKRASELSAREEFVLYGDPNATREFIHPLDVATGMMYAIMFGDNREAYNIGCNGQNTISMTNLARLILDRYSLDNTIVSDSSLGGGDNKRYSSTAKLNALGWKHFVTLEEIVSETILDWETRNK